MVIVPAVTLFAVRETVSAVPTKAATVNPKVVPNAVLFAFTAVAAEGIFEKIAALVKPEVSN